ncbi:hypothetical protein SUGI_1015120 [Cryptomeria japonica]|nr:hypothetical protein SUGI_1015120 [Cryptomeria japonica]
MKYNDQESGKTLKEDMGLQRKAQFHINRGDEFVVENITFKEALVDQNVLSGGVAFIPKEIDRDCNRDDGGGHRGNEVVQEEV